MEQGGTSQGVQIGEGKALLSLKALSAELFVFEVHTVPPASRELIAVFPCTYSELEWVFDNGGSFQSATAAGSLCAMAGSDEMWIAYQINDPPLEESCVVPLEPFKEDVLRCHVVVSASLM